jgi:CheY-like chemotaxis protein
MVKHSGRKANKQGAPSATPWTTPEAKSRAEPHCLKKRGNRRSALPGRSTRLIFAKCEAEKRPRFKEIHATADKLPGTEGVPMKRVLIVEDQSEIRELIRMTLEMEDYDIHEAEDGRVGLQKAAQLAPNLMLLDVMMPGGIDGFSVCEKIRADARLKKTKVVMLTARAQPDDLARGKAAGADAYLVKPFSPRELLNVVTRLA